MKHQAKPNLDIKPGISTELIEWLEEAFPDKCIGPTEPETLAHRRAGMVDLISTMRSWHDAQLRVELSQDMLEDDD